MEQRLATVKVHLLASQLSREDYSTEGERVAEKALVDNGKQKLVEETEELFDAFGIGAEIPHEEYVDVLLRQSKLSRWKVEMMILKNVKFHL